MPGDESARLVHPLRLPALVGRLRPPGGGAPETEPAVSGADFAALLPDVARRLLGDPPRIGADEWRYGSRGSLAVHPARGTWHDFEAATGGGTLALIEHLQQTDKAGALRWLVDARLIAAPAGPDAPPAAPRRPGGASTPPAPGPGGAYAETGADR